MLKISLLFLEMYELLGQVKSLGLRMRNFQGIAFV